MRKNVKLPRILKINWIKDLTISVVFNNGESRIIDFHNVFDQMGVKKGTPAYSLYNPEEFSKVELQGPTLSWINAGQWITLLNGKKGKVPFEIGPDTLYEFSKPEKSNSNQQIGCQIKEARLKSGITQQELAMRSGTTRNYISRIENNRSDIELGTLRKIIEIGLGKKMEIRIR
jgi:DNA-binding XRE family transcriptional regulator